jgi:hypothetical protein
VILGEMPQVVFPPDHSARQHLLSMRFRTYVSQ